MTYHDEAKDTEGAQPASLATIWKCPDCGSRIQIMVASPRGRAQRPFTCVCGVEMVPGEERPGGTNTRKAG